MITYKYIKQTSALREKKMQKKNLHMLSNRSKYHTQKFLCLPFVLQKFITGKKLIMSQFSGTQ